MRTFRCKKADHRWWNELTAGAYRFRSTGARWGGGLESRVLLLRSARSFRDNPGAPAILLTIVIQALIVAPARAQDPATGADATAARSSAERIRELESRPWVIHAARVRPEDVEVDGRLDEAAWQTAEVINEFYQRSTREVTTASERTEVRALYDDEYLYLGVWAWDNEPEKMEIKAIFNNEGSPGDVMNIVIDAYHAHRSALQFSTNANGVLHDWLQTGETAATRDDSFDTVWMSRGRRLPYGYEIEVAIPFTSLRFEAQPPGQEVIFGIGFRRNIPRKNEEAIWPYVSRDSDWQRPAEYGHLRGLIDVRPGRNLEVRPYVLGGATRDFSRALTDTRRDVGMDVKWGVTPALTADFSVNTDFAQEEADVQQVNLTRFSLFFPEKRQFFLEGRQAFQFGVGREIDLAFTRRIGLSPAGQPVPIRAGARLSGREGPTSIGAMNIQTADASGLPGQNFSVIRLKRDMLARSSIGGILTNVQGGGQVNRVYGADASFYLRRLWFLEGWLAGMDESGASRSGAGYGRVAYERDRVGAGYTLLSIGEGFRPGVGFVRRPDSRQHASEVRFSPRPQWNLVRQLHFRGTVDYTTNQQNVLESRDRAASAQVEFETGHIATLTSTNVSESIATPFRLRSDVAIASGVYTFNNVALTVQTPSRRHLNIRSTITTGGFWNGSRDEFVTSGDYRPSTHLKLSWNYSINRVSLPGGRWTSHLLSSGFMIPFDANMAILSLFQYNRDTRQISSNIRFRWIPKPRSDFYIVYNELDSDDPRLIRVNRSLTVKMNYSLSL